MTERNMKAPWRQQYKSPFKEDALGPSAAAHGMPRKVKSRAWRGASRRVNYGGIVVGLCL